MTEIIKNSVFELRNEAGMTQEMLAHKLGVSRQTIIAIEKGNYTPSVALALKAGHVFKKSVEDIFRLSTKK